jgi:hypothetical protein
MSIAHSVAEILKEHVTLEIECIDRMYLNVYVPQLQYERGVAAFFQYHRGQRFASSALMAPITAEFVSSIESFAQYHGIELFCFEKGQRKDDLMLERLARFPADEGVVFIGKAQEKAPVLRTERRRNPTTGAPYPWLVRSTAPVNHYYLYCLDKGFGPFFLKFCSYFPYNAKLCINGHEFLKRQLALRGVDFQPLDNGLLSVDDPALAQRICDSLSPDMIDALLRKWLKLLPHPFSPADRRAGFRYDLSILQAEFSLTQVLPRPMTGRSFFEQVIRDNLDIGHPSQVQLIFDRRTSKRTPGRFRTRVLTTGVTPSLHVDYKHCRIKQYHKEGRALRTETTINNTRDFGIGRRLDNLPALRKIGFSANRRLLDVQRTSHDCLLGEQTLTSLQTPTHTPCGHASALRFADPRVQSLLVAILSLAFLPTGFANRDLRKPLAELRGLGKDALTQGQLTYELRRLRLHGLIVRIPRSHRYRLTDSGLRIALFYTRTYAHILRPGLALALPSTPAPDSKLRAAFSSLDAAIGHFCDGARLAA